MTGQPVATGTPAPRYEARDADARRLLQLGLSLCLVMALVMLSVSKLMPVLLSRQHGGPPASPIAATRELPPKPRLQIAPPLDLAAKQKADDAMLNSYGWIDRSTGTIRIAIDRAMDLLAEP